MMAVLSTKSHFLSFSVPKWISNFLRILCLTECKLGEGGGNDAALAADFPERTTCFLVIGFKCDGVIASSLGGCNRKIIRLAVWRFEAKSGVVWPCHQAQITVSSWVPPSASSGSGWDFRRKNLQKRRTCIQIFSAGWNGARNTFRSRHCGAWPRRLAFVCETSSKIFKQGSLNPPVCFTFLSGPKRRPAFSS